MTKYKAMRKAAARVPMLGLLMKEIDLAILADKVANQLDERKGEDVEVWAKRLSSDLSQLCD